MCGPTAIGVMYGKYHLLEKMEPLMLGGGMNSSFDASFNVLLKEAPHKFEAGTPNIEAVLGLKAAIQYLQALEWIILPDMKSNLENMPSVK